MDFYLEPVCGLGEQLKAVARKTLVATFFQIAAGCTEGLWLLFGSQVVAFHISTARGTPIFNETEKSHLVRCLRILPWALAFSYPKPQFSNDRSCRWERPMKRETGGCLGG